MKNVIFFLFMIAIGFSTASQASLSLDLRSEYESWNNGINGRTSALLFGLGGTRSINQLWSITGGFVMGEHDGSDERQDKLKRSDMDLAVGYHFRPNITLFAGYRLVSIDYTNRLDTDRSFEDLTHGIGVGVSTFLWVYPKTHVYGRFGLSGLYSVLDSNTTGKDKGLGLSSGLEVGIIYQFMENSNVGFSLKQQNTSIDYRGDSSKWNHNYVRLGLSLSRSF